MIREVATNDRLDSPPLHGQRQMTAPKELLADLLQLRSHSGFRGPAEQQEPSFRRLPTDVGEAEEVKGRRFPLPAFTSALFGKAAKLQQTCLFGVYLEPEALETSLKVASQTDRVRLVLETHHKSSL